MQVNLLRTESGDTKSAHFGADVIPHALESKLKVVAHHFDGYWRVSTNIILDNSFCVLSEHVSWHLQSA